MERERRTTWRSPGSPPGQQHGPAHLHFPPCRLPPRASRHRRVADARRRTPRPPPACRSTSTPRTPPCVPRHPPGTPSLFRTIPPSSASSLPHSPEWSRRHRRAPSRPPPPPSLADALKGCASTPSSSPLPHGPPEALDAASFAVPLLGHRGSPPSNPPPSGLPQARRPPLQGLRELSVRFPLSVSSFARRS